MCNIKIIYQEYILLLSGCTPDVVEAPAKVPNGNIYTCMYIHVHVAKSNILIIVQA